ncbi:hypothetical protein [Modestobacter sp. Leaf380]|uniref:hypothetical protein n=1 Tax=Modestobacter sp. Leaf380 TaxID=1736356 RepID=UPI000ACC3208|nr:hypothetical protein [Modestobacter sp. Leaf380]
MVAEQLAVPGTASAESVADPTSTVRVRRSRRRAPAEVEERRCGWCRSVLPAQESVGRPRLYCGQACRQRAYEQRSATAKAGLSPDVVLVTRTELDGLQDRLFQLRCALEDVQTLMTEKPTKAELEKALSELIRSTGRLDRLWLSGKNAG